MGCCYKLCSKSDNKLCHVAHSVHDIFRPALFNVSPGARRSTDIIMNIVVMGHDYTHLEDLRIHILAEIHPVQLLIQLNIIVCIPGQKNTAEFPIVIYTVSYVIT